jgi:Aerotolerance regulator N-terminal/von Willebrand factor type A domain
VAFLYPVFLAGAIAIAIPIVLHLLRRDVAPEIPFPAVRLLRRTPLEQTRRRRIRDLLLLAARVAALVLLAAAFARPYFTEAAGDSPLVIVAVDRSYSMGAPGRFERALTLAREAIDATRRGDRIAVVAFDDRADVLSAPGGAGEARAALTGLRAGFGGTRYPALLARATELSEQSAARLIVITDMQRAGWEDGDPVVVPQTLRIETRDAGATPSNTAVVALRREPAAVVASVQNTGAASVTGSARVVLDGRTVSSSPYSIPAGATTDVPLAYRAPERGALGVEIEDAAGYVADNRRFLALDPAGRTRILVVVGDPEQSGFYVTRALQAGVDDAFDIQVRPSSSLGTIRSEEFAGNGAVLLLTTRTLDRRARELLAGFVRGGGGLLVAAASDVDPAVLAAVMQWPGFSAVEQAAGPSVLAATDLRHPIFRPFGALAANLGQIRFTRAWLVRSDGWDVAARFTDGAPALLERREGKGRVVVFASDLDRRWNDFPLHPAFVPFAVECVRHITATSVGRRDYAVAHAPRGARAEPGIYTLPDSGRQITVNVDVRESATTRMTAEEFAAMVQTDEAPASAPVGRRAQHAEGRQNLWRYGVLLMLLALVAESLVGRTR